jgi:hypothetical protein
MRPRLTDGLDEEMERVAAARVADRCSNPCCRALTSGPHNDRRQSLTVGLAVHITALSPRGRRYDPVQSDEERGDPGNAIWLCHNCVRLIDNDVARHSAGLLRTWKLEAEA